MNSTDKKLYELFPTKDITLTDEFTWNQMTFKREPQLHDVFRVAEEKPSIDIIVWNWFLSIVDYITDEVKEKLSYNPTLPLLQQSENEYNEEWHLVKMWTKEQIISLFS
jgi:hypothetical protein